MTKNILIFFLIWLLLNGCKRSSANVFNRRQNANALILGLLHKYLHLIQKLKMTRLIFLTFLIVFSICTDITEQDRMVDKNKEVKSTKTSSLANVHEARLGQPDYFIQLPDTNKKDFIIQK